MNIEPFGYFRALPLGWEDCGEDDEGAVPLYDHKTVDDLCAIIKKREEDCEYWHAQYSRAIVYGQD